MSKQTSIKWDVEYRVDRYKIGKRIEIVPVIETINGKPVSDFPVEIVKDVTETLWNDDDDFNMEVEARKIG
jgi:hypothetical protein